MIYGRGEATFNVIVGKSERFIELLRHYIRLERIFSRKVNPPPVVTRRYGKNVVTSRI